LSLPGSGNTSSKAESVRIPRTEEFYRKIYQQVSTGLAIADWHGVFQECNPAFCALLGYTEDELRIMHFVSLIHPEDLEANLVHVRRLQVGEIPSFEIENRYSHKNGKQHI
jgi:PAS domain S-box-containing protein